MPPIEPDWRWRFLVLRAAWRLCAARLLIACWRFGRWRHLLGRAEAARGAIAPGMDQSGVIDPADWRMAAAVERAARRLPFRTLCLPRAMALHWLLKSANRPARLYLGVLPGAARGTLDDLHAWVEREGRVLIGLSERRYNILICFTFAGLHPGREGPDCAL